jgi:hypothetical protein
MLWINLQMVRLRAHCTRHLRQPDHFRVPVVEPEVPLPWSLEGARDDTGNRIWRHLVEVST